MPGNVPQPPVGTPSAALISALRRILRPLARLVVANGITLPRLTELLKSVLVEVAAREFTINGKPQTDSRINLITGVHRKDVRRLRQETPSDEDAPSSISMGAQLVALWTSDPKYLDRDGHPRSLARLASEDPRLSFEELVRSISSDIRSRVVLDEWLRLGVAYLDDDARVCLRAEAFVPTEGAEEKAYFLGLNVADHLASATHNLLGEQPPYLERNVYYENLSPESVDKLAILAGDAGMEALKKVNRRARSLQAQDSGKKGTDQRMNFGLFFFHTDDPPPSDPD